MFKMFYPAGIAGSSYDIDYEDLFEKGYRGLIYDIDNTLVEHGADCNEAAAKLFLRLTKLGYKICLLSNNKEPRVRRFYDGLIEAGVDVTNINYIYDAKKPSRKNYRRAMKLMSTDRKNTIFIGDQLFTDVYGANRTGIRSFLVRPINKREEIQIVLKRYLERVVLHFYKQDRWKKLKQSNVVLIGFMGSGKSTVGKALAKKWGFTYVDTDALIEEMEGMTINEIFATKGEEYFRDLETETVKKIKNKYKRHVISVGGGTPLRAENRKLLKKTGVVIYLKTSPETVLKRLKYDKTRPLLQRPDKEAAVRELLEKRTPIYQSAANFSVSTDDLPVDKIVSEIELGV